MRWWGWEVAWRETDREEEGSKPITGVVPIASGIVSCTTPIGKILSCKIAKKVFAITHDKNARISYLIYSIQFENRKSLYHFSYLKKNCTESLSVKTPFDNQINTCSFVAIEKNIYSFPRRLVICDRRVSTISMIIYFFYSESL